MPPGDTKDAQAKIREAQQTKEAFEEQRAEMQRAAKDAADAAKTAKEVQEAKVKLQKEAVHQAQLAETKSRAVEEVRLHSTCFETYNQKIYSGQEAKLKYVCIVFCPTSHNMDF